MIILARSSDFLSSLVIILSEGMAMKPTHNIRASAVLWVKESKHGKVFQKAA